MDITRKQVRRLMRKAGLKSIYPKKNLSKPHKAHKKYPYLLKNKKICFPNQVWATDITFCKLNGSTVYIAAILDLFSRKILSWRISNTMDVSFVSLPWKKLLCTMEYQPFSIPIKGRSLLQLHL